jgi:hypothetical protein
MSGDDEIREYLYHLLDHQGSCTIKHCATCQMALNVYEAMRSRIFSAREYPGVANNANPPVAERDDPAIDTRRRAVARKG